MRPFGIIPVVFVAAVITMLNWSAPPAFAATYTVDTAADDPGVALTGCTGAAGDCSLRGAIVRANQASTPGDVVNFAPSVFPTGGAPTAIVIATPLPALTGGGGDTISGTGAAVVIRGPEDRTVNCMPVGSNNVVTGLQFTDCNVAIHMTGTTGNTTIGPANMFYDSQWGVAMVTTGSGIAVIGNTFGLNAAGTALHPDGANSIPVSIAGTNNRVGGASPADRNVIAGSTGMGVHVVAGTGHQVYGNYIGTDVTGLVDLGNATGVQVESGASGVNIGGFPGGQGNLISGNSNAQIYVASASGNYVTHNRIGLDSSGVPGAMVSGDGIRVGSIGAPASGNNIVGNTIGATQVAIQIFGANASSNLIKGNGIGTTTLGVGSFGNAEDGVLIYSGAHDNVIGGLAPGEANFIANNLIGVSVEMSGSTGNAIRGNSIHDNTLAEIELLAGGNTELPAPQIGMAGFGAVGGTACPLCMIDVFSDGASDAEVYEGTTLADSSGNWSLYDERSVTYWTATATNASGNTSELSAAAGAVDLDVDSDGVPDLLDNCFGTANGPGQVAIIGAGYQDDADGDGINGAEGATGTAWGGDACDADDDNDGIPDTLDVCRTLAEDFDGWQDGDTCPDADNDGDGTCDAGLTSVSCTGSDVGRYLWKAPLGGTFDCRNVAEDYDSFHDGDGCPEPDNDYDTFPDAADGCPAVDANVGADGIADTGDEPVLYLTPYKAREDFDGVIDIDGCHDSPEDDYDLDSSGILDGGGLPIFRDEREALFLGTDPIRACAQTPASDDEPSPDAWPFDFNDDQRATLPDVLRYIPVFGAFSPSPQYNPRFDLDASGGITLGDVLLYIRVFTKSCAA